MKSEVRILKKLDWDYRNGITYFIYQDHDKFKVGMSHKVPINGNDCTKNNELKK